MFNDSEPSFLFACLLPAHDMVFFRTVLSVLSLCSGWKFLCNSSVHYGLNFSSESHGDVQLPLKQCKEVEASRAA